MTDDALKDQILEQIETLPFEERRRVLDFARALVSSTTLGVSGRGLRRFTGIFEAEDAREMAEAVEEGCEKIDLNEW